MPAEKSQAIDDVLETLYALDLQGYQLDAKILKGEALNRIRRTLSRLDGEKRKTVEDETNYRLERFEKFSHLPGTQREEIIRVAKERNLSLEEAYAVVSKG